MGEASMDARRHRKETAGIKALLAEARDAALSASPPRS